MGRTGHHWRPQVEGFETRALLSAGLGGASAVAAVAGASTHAFHLQGKFHGEYQVVSPIPDVGATFNARGSGRLHGIGHTSLDGSFRSIGFIANGVAQGDITLVRPNGTITLHLTGPVQHGGPTGLPSVFGVGVTGATGKFKGIHGIGSATLTLVPGQGGGVGGNGGSRTFTLVITPRPLPL
jgi:hypothetical protein